jgi:hypothetical protein
LSPVPEGALRELAAQLRAERSVISPHVVEPSAAPALGLLVASCPRAAADRAEYALLIESIREGYLLHYGAPRLLAGHDEDLALLAGDYLYARGLERLAALGDAEAVGELADLISLCAECHAEGRPELADALWLAAACAVACGGSRDHAEAKEAGRELDPDAAERLRQAASAAAAANGLEGELRRAAESIDLWVPRLADRG